jgi:hypothetical protein
VHREDGRVARAPRVQYHAARALELRTRHTGRDCVEVHLAVVPGDEEQEDEEHEEQDDDGKPMQMMSRQRGLRTCMMGGAQGISPWAVSFEPNSPGGPILHMTESTSRHSSSPPFLSSERGHRGPSSLMPPTDPAG